MPVINIAIVEDDNEIRNSMVSSISQCDDMYCVAEYDSAEGLCENFKTLQVDVVLMDITLPEMTGIHCVGELKPKRPEVQFMMCTAHSDADKIFDSLCAGATGYLLKDAPVEKILTSIRELYNGGSPMSPQIARLVVNTFPVQNQNKELLDSLTTREREILNVLAKGYQYKQVADQLNISVETVRTYVRKVYEKLHVHSRTEALNKLFPKGGPD